MPDLPEVLTLQEVAETLHCSTRTLRRRINEGRLRASHVTDRGGWVVQRRDLLAFLDNRANDSTPPAPVVPAERGSAGTRRRGAARGQLVVTEDMGRVA